MLKQLKPEIKKAWLEALRSGKYVQGHQALRTADSRYCCLGVLCDVVNPNDWHSSGPFAWTYGVEGDIGVTPKALRTDVQLDADAENKLINMNDVDGADFEHIAQYIEQNL